MSNILKYQNPARSLLESKDTLNTGYLTFKRTLPDNLRLTPEKDYHMYDYWILNGKPENFREGKRRGMFTWDNSDKGYHAGSIAEDKNTGIYHFMKPKHHPTVKYELDWFNKGLQTLEGGKQVPVEGKDKEFWEDFKSKYQLDTTGVDYRYVPIQKKGGRIHIKKKNRGKFTAAAKRAGMGVQEFARHVLANKDKYSSTLVKRANFARNSKKFKHENGGILKAQEGTGNLHSPHPLSPIGIALNQAKVMAKMKGEQQHLPPGVKEVVGPDGKKVAIRTEQPLVPLEQNVAEWLPGTGDVAEVGYFADDVKNGRYGSAALTAAMVALPGNVGKIFRKTDVPTSKLTEAERLGIPKGQRSNPKALDNPQYWGYEQWNERYNAAVRAGNWEEAQRLRDLHFMSKAPNTKIIDEKGMPQHMYHGVEHTTLKGKPYRFTKYRGVNWDLEELVESGDVRNHWRLSKPNDLRMTSYHTPSYRKAFGYGQHNPTLVHDDYLNITNPFTWDEEKIHQILLNAGRKSEKIPYKERGRFKERIVKDENGKIMRDKFGEPIYEKGEWIPEKSGFTYPQVSDWANFADDSKEELMKLGYDGLYIPQYYNSYGAFISPSQFKSADPITWDGKGEIIPIVKRDNFRNLDSRYQKGGKL